MSVFELKTLHPSAVSEEIKLFELNAHPIVTKRKIAKARDVYFSRHLKPSLLISDLASLIGDKKQPSHNTYRNMILKTEQITVESGRTEYETAFMFGAETIKNELATDIINGVFYRSRNDNPLCIDYLLPLLRENISESAKRVLIVLPSPDMILSWNQVGVETVYAVPDRCIKDLYRHQFEKEQGVSFVTFEEIPALRDIDIALLISNNLFAEDALDLLCAIPCDVKKVFALLPGTAFSKCTEDQKVVCSERYHLNAVLLLPQGACKSQPRRKIVAMFTHTPSETVLLQTAFLKDNQVFLDRKSGYISADSVFQKNKTLKALYQKSIARPAESVKDYKKAKQYAFSEEILMNYTIQEKGEYFAGKAYYSAPVQSDKRVHGQRLTRLIERGLRGKTEQAVVDALQNLFFSPSNVAPKENGNESQTLDKVVLNELYDRFKGNFSELSLKTIWFVLRDRLREKTTQYHETAAKVLFCGKVQSLSKLHPIHAQVEEIQCAMEEVLTFEDDDARLKYWLQLDLIYKTAMQAGILPYNPIQYILPSVSKRATERQQQIRNAMTKKNLETEEENRLLELLSAQTKDPLDEHSRLPLYIVDSKALLVAVRFFTGISNSEACLLNQSSILYSKRPNLARLQIFKPQKDDRKENTDEIKNRFIPLVQPLVEMIHARRDYIKRRFGVDPEKQKDAETIPLFYETEPQSPEEVLRNERCKPETSAKYTKKVIKMLGLQQQMIVLPGDDKSKDSLLVDLFRYQGDILRSNYRFHANHDAALTMGELCYCLGIQPPDTYSCHYCDFGNVFIQYAMKEKLHRWTVKHPALLPDRGSINPVHTQFRLDKDISHTALPQGSAPAWSVYQVNVIQKHPKEMTICAESEHGLTGELAFYRKEGPT